MKVALAQIDTTVGDIDGNAARIVETARRAEDRGAEIVVFPELTLTGYPPRDLLFKHRFVAANLEALERLARLTRGGAWLVGFVARGEDGQSLHNAAALLAGGAVRTVARKLLLPTYDVFDESRYFKPGDDPTVAELGGHVTGIAVCEDVWNDSGFWGKAIYPREPVAELVARGARSLLVLSASPFSTGRIALRVEMMRAHARRWGLPLVYVNQTGGNDSLVFDGSSFALDREGRLLGMCRPFAEDLVVVDLEARGEAAMPAGSDASWAFEALVRGTRDYASKCGFKQAVIGLSGGIDSSLTAVIAAQALGPENVWGVAMPSRYSSKESVEDARELSRRLGIRHDVIPIDPVFDAYLRALDPLFSGTEPGASEENVQARIRGNMLMALSNKFGHLVLSTGNKSELAVGYCTLYGDMSGGLAVISDLPKTFVYEVARHANSLGDAIPDRVFTKAPSAELRPDQTDQDTLPPYEVLDRLLRHYVEESLSPDEIVALGFDAALVCRVTAMVDRSEYKRNQAAPGLRVTSKAFGVGRRMPLAQRYRPAEPVAEVAR